MNDPYGNSLARLLFQALHSRSSGGFLSISICIENLMRIPNKEEFSYRGLHEYPSQMVLHMSSLRDPQTGGFVRILTEELSEGAEEEVATIQIRSLDGLGRP